MAHRPDHCRASRLEQLRQIDLDARQPFQLHDPRLAQHAPLQVLAGLRRAERMQEVKEGEKIKRTVHVPVRMTSAAHLDNLIQQLQALKDELMLHPDIEITLEIKD